MIISRAHNFKPIKRLISQYGGVSLEGNVNESISYLSPTPIQEKIELSITHGQGYLSLQQSMDLINQQGPKIYLSDVLEGGVVPIYFKETPTQLPTQFYINPCEEFPIGKSETLSLPIPKTPTLLERLSTIQFIKHHENCLKTGCFT